LVAIADLLGAFLTILAAVFLAELTDKDALLLVALATRTKPRTLFAAGSIAFVMTTVVIVLAGSVLIIYVPIFWIKVAGGAIMLAYALWELRGVIGIGEVEKTEGRLLKRTNGLGGRAFLSVIGALAALDLAGDATELLIIVFVAHFRDPLLVFVSASTALIAATALETIVGNKMGAILSPQRIRYVSIGIFLILGISIILTSLFLSS
jgi:putative Ca2+/H+ antiporter (TMEM165/GDT1 family)